MLERRRRVASLVLRPVDALRETMNRPPDERGPLGPVRLRIEGRVDGSDIRALPPKTSPPVRNLSGDTVFVDLRLPAATYRLALERDPRDRLGDRYEELDAAQRDVAWDPDTPPPGLPDGTPHPARLLMLRLRPSASYPFPPGLPLVRGTLRWFDGDALAGAVVREPGALVPESRVDAGGSWALAFPGAKPNGPANLELLVDDVDANAKPSGGAYLAVWPKLWPTQWKRAATVTQRQPSLEGLVLGPDDRPVEGANVTLVGFYGNLATARDGRWRYYFPPATAAGTADVVVQRLGHPDVTLFNVPFAAAAASQAPVARLN